MPAERTADAQANYLAACEAMRQRRDLPAWRASLGKPTARIHSLSPTVTTENERHGIGRLWFDGASWHPRLVLGRQRGRRGPLELVVLAKLPPAMPDAGLADAPAAACCGLFLADLRQVQRAVLCRATAAVP
jgi:hypothetical protein